ncbi:MAG: hypothetical protein IJ348_04735 [Alistipes sp.]|nr:hypothetical protein [Alistipes sp.]
MRRFCIISLLAGLCLLLPDTLAAQEGGVPVTDAAPTATVDAQNDGAPMLTQEQMVAYGVQADTTLSRREKQRLQRQLQKESYFDTGYFGSVNCAIGLMSPHLRFASGLDIVNGYNWRWFGLGFGVGYCTRAGVSRSYMTLPLFITLRAEIMDSKVTPIVSLNLGYAYGKQVDGKPADDGFVKVKPVEGNMAYGEAKVGFGVHLAPQYVLDFMWGFSVHYGDSFEFGPKFGLGFRW